MRKTPSTQKFTILVRSWVIFPMMIQAGKASNAYKNFKKYGAACAPEPLLRDVSCGCFCFAEQVRLITQTSPPFTYPAVLFWSFARALLRGVSTTTDV
jgi:hypothetical protein